MAYHPIEHYGIVGNMRTVALVGKNGAIDWMCLPRFDSPSVFAGILDSKKGGTFRIHAVADSEPGVVLRRPKDIRQKQFYWPDTNVLVTRFLSPDGVGQVVDYMPVVPSGEKGHLSLVRTVQSVRGNVLFRMECNPAFNYGRDGHETSIDGNGAIFKSDSLTLSLSSPVPLKGNDRGVTAEFTVSEGEEISFVIAEGKAAGLSGEEDDRLLRETVDYWRRWLSHCTYRGRWREMVYRSALALKLMTYEPTGAIVASPTCSLPEGIGGERNWDYRYTWIRDAAFTLYGFLRIGFTEEAAQFMRWLEERCLELNPDGSLQIMYGIDGRHKLTEETLDHLEGYKGSTPVRVGNGAYGQLQLDIYGELMDSVYLYNKYGSPISYDLWRHLRKLVDWVCDNWERTDEGIWEVRGGQRHFVYSKLMCWVAIDRGIRLAEKRSFPADHTRWITVRDQIYEEIMSKGWDPGRGAFTQSYGTSTLDASNLIMPLVFFVSPSDPRMLQTLDEIMKPPHKGGLVSDSLVFRYDVDKTDDGLEGEEGTFNICTFWLVEALTRAGKTDPERLREARLIFEKMLGYANHLGLYSEQTGLNGEALGNTPQAFTHLALISAAFNLDRALGKRD